MARRSTPKTAPSAAQAWVQARAVQANRNFGNRKPVARGMPFGMRPVSQARGQYGLVDPETDIWQMPISADDPVYGGDTKTYYDEAAEAFEFADEYFAYDDVGYTYNFDPDRGGSHVPVTSGKKDTSPAPITIVPTNTTNPDRPRTVAAGYDKDRQVITVVFRDGTFYNYYDVPYRMWQGFRMSQSKGRYILDILDHQPRGHASAEAVPVTVRSALYNVMRVGQVTADETWQQPDLYAIHQGRQARKARKR